MSEIIPMFGPICCKGSGRARCSPDSDGSTMCKVKTDFLPDSPSHMGKCSDASYFMLTGIAWSGADGKALGPITNWSQLSCDATYEDDEDGRKFF